MEMTQEVLMDWVDYEPVSGVFTWREVPAKYFETRRKCRLWNTRCSGNIASVRHTCNYLKVTICDVQYLAHRLAILYMSGSFPEDATDHINGVRDDNRWCNLRTVTRKQNSRNCKLGKDNTSGHSGVVAVKNRWLVAISSHSVGSFKDKGSAILARRIAEVIFGYHPNHGREEQKMHCLACNNIMSEQDLLMKQKDGSNEDLCEACRLVILLDEDLSCDEFLLKLNENTG